MKKRWMRLALAACLIACMMPVTALAGEAHDHDGWAEVRMDGDDPNWIDVGGTPTEHGNLSTGRYYLAGDITLPLAISGEVELCLNGHGVLASVAQAVTVNAGGKLTLCDCAGGGKIEYTGSGSRYGIYNAGTLAVRGGAIESAYRGVYNSGSARCTLTGGSVQGGIYGIYNASGESRLYLSGTPSVTGGAAGVYTNGSMSSIYANDGAADNPTAYCGSPVTLAYASVANGHTAVYYVTEENCGSFVLANAEGYTLTYETNLKRLQFEAQAQTLHWYGGAGEALSGEQYPDSAPYGTELAMPQPEMEGNIFFGWRYKCGENDEWSSEYWPGGAIQTDMAFMADCMDGFAGSGTAETPFEIATAGDLQKLAAVVNRGLTAYNNGAVYYRLTADIDLSAVCGEHMGNWTPIGSSGNGFAAKFDGGGKTISNLYIDTPDGNQGLFGCLRGARVKDLTITGTLSAGEGEGALAGEILDSAIEGVDVSGVDTAPYGYTAGSGSAMAYRQNGTVIDVKGNYKGSWIPTTVADSGYEIETSGFDSASVTAAAEFRFGGRYVRLRYTVTAGSSEITDGKLAVHAHPQIGENAQAAVEAIRDPGTDETIGLKMADGASGAQLNWYVDGANPAGSFWLEDVAAREAGGSGFAVSWQDICLQPNESRTYSFLLGVGEKADAPRWGGDSPLHLTLAAGGSAEDGQLLIDVSAVVTDAAGQTDALYCSVDGGADAALSQVQADGTEQTVTGQIALRGAEDGAHALQFRVVNTAGALSPTLTRTVVMENGKIVAGLDAETPPAPVMCTVTFDAQGGSEVASITVESGSTLRELPTTTREGHIFGGWFTGLDGGGEQLSASTQITQDIPYYAKWTEIQPAPKPDAPDHAPVIWPAARPGKAPEDNGCPSRAFDDLDVGQWYHEAADYVLESGLMRGNHGKFYPDEGLTRAQLAQILYNAEKQPAASGQSAFCDVKSGAWYFDAVTWASEHGIVTGFSGGAFRPDAPVTREQLAVMLWRYAQLKRYDTTQGGMMVREFSDYGSISSYAKDAMTWAVSTGVVGGFADHSLRPQGSATRAQAAAILLRFCKSIAD